MKKLALVVVLMLACSTMLYAETLAPTGNAWITMSDEAKLVAMKDIYSSLNVDTSEYTVENGVKAVDAYYGYLKDKIIVDDPDVNPQKFLSISIQDLMAELIYGVETQGTLKERGER